MDPRLIFDEDAGNYDRARPGYPAELYAAIFAYSGAGAGTRALEIGVGTGQATPPFLEKGCSVTAVELGARLSRRVKQKFRDRPGFQVLQGDFLDCELPAGSFDLAYCATAFHWLPGKRAYPRLRELLREGGTLALFWNHPFPNREEDETNRANRRVYRKYRPDAEEQREFCEADCAKRAEELRAYGFCDVRASLFHRVRRLTAAEYIDLLNTYSDHRALPPRTRAAFEQDMKTALEAAGGFVNIYDTVDLYLARK